MQRRTAPQGGQSACRFQKACWPWPLESGFGRAEKGSSTEGAGQRPKTTLEMRFAARAKSRPGAGPEWIRRGSGDLQALQKFSYLLGLNGEVSEARIALEIVPV
jgi:hypothetical protein